MAELREKTVLRPQDLTRPSMDLVGSCRSSQQILEEAVGSVLKTERLLRENASEVRGQVQSLVSRQQEALRCRELWLLGQIEILEQVKSETLHQQLLSLTRLRAQLDLISDQLQNQPISNELSNHLTSQLTQLTDSLASLSLTPDETPDICFHGDSRSLRSAITSFGSVTSSALSPAPKRQKTGGALEEWLLGAGSKPVAMGNQSSKNPQDWLAAPSQSQVNQVQTEWDFIKSWGRGQLQDLEAWLAKETTPSAPASDAVSDRRRSFSCSSSSSFEEIDQSELSEGLGAVLRPFEEPWESSDWLHARAQTDCSSCTRPKPALEIENLGLLRCLKTQTRTQTTDQTRTNPDQTRTNPDQTRTNPDQTRTNPDQTRTNPDQTRTNPDQKKTQDQIKSPAESLKSRPRISEADLESWLQQVAPVQKVCKANEPCSSLRSCVCEQNCGRDALNAWLLRRDGRDKNGVKITTLPPATPTERTTLTTPTERTTLTTPTERTPVPNSKKMPDFYTEREQKVQAILEAWLHPLTTSPAPLLSSPAPSCVSVEKTEESCPFQRPLEADQWVLLPKTSANQTPESNTNPAPASPEPEPAPLSPEEDRWLLKKRVSAQERSVPLVCDLFSCMKLNKDKNQWLHTPTLQM